MFADIIAGNRQNPGKADVGEGNAGEGAILATSYVS
jgi:hypothetical protein